MKRLLAAWLLCGTICIVGCDRNRDPSASATDCEIEQVSPSETDSIETGDDYTKLY